jgi:predicted transcriptional regulator
MLYEPKIHKRELVRAREAQWTSNIFCCRLIFMLLKIEILLFRNLQSIVRFSVRLMAKRTRSSVQITAEILNLCKEPQTKTHVMYRTNLSWIMLMKYLSQLQSQGLLETSNTQTRYTSTQRGLKLVDKWREITELLSF